MQNLLNPRWLFIINTLPIAVLFFLFYGEYHIIKSLLEEENIAQWKFFGWSLAFIALLNLGYGIYLTVQKQKVTAIYGLVALLCYISYLYLYSVHSEDILPRDIPQWMIPGNMHLYVGTFLMPTLAYSLFVLVAHFTPNTKNHKASNSFLIAVAIPVVWYIFAQIILPFWQPVHNEFGMHAGIILLIIGTLLFLFFLIRCIYIIATKKAEEWRKYQLFWKIPITIILPLIGLAFNNGDMNSLFSQRNPSGIFGDFNNIWFFVLAILNGIFICLPNLENKSYRLFLFAGRSITFAYTFYFFIVFLPLLPLSVVAIIAFGIGFLLLAPLLLMVLHSLELSRDYTFLKSHYSGNKLKAVAIAAFLVLPISITLNYLNDKRTLNQALEYIYSPDYSAEYDIDKKALGKTLNVIRSHKSRNNSRDFFGQGQPYLSSYYKWLVLDNLTLSNSKLRTLESIFEGEQYKMLASDNIRNDSVIITDISSTSTFDKSQNAWKSWIDLEITNKNDVTFSNEYATTLELPVGTWISDYYLYVGDRKEMGILAEKKTAMWVFSNIRGRNRDPGILYYLSRNKVAFRVFPFAQGEVRRTGIELLHKEPIEFKIDGNTLKLGDSTKIYQKGFEDEDIIYVASTEKEKLKKVKRKPYVHFVVDASSEKKMDDYTNRIETFAKKHKNLTKNAKISFVNSYVSTHPFNNEWKQEYENQSFEGGFFAERAIKSLLFDAHQANNASYPIIVTVSEGLNNAIFLKDFSDWQSAFPETELFYNIGAGGKTTSHSLISQPQEIISEDVELALDHSVLKYKMKDKTLRYLKDNGQASIILKNDLLKTDESEIKSKHWNSALTIQAKWTSQIIHPEIADKTWLEQVRYSFLSKVMSPVTSYLVVENEAQKAILKKKQKEVLSGNRSLDLDDDTSRMSEPGLIVLAIMLCLILWIRKRRQKKVIHQ